MEFKRPRPVDDWMLVEKVKEDEMTRGGIFIPPTANNPLDKRTAIFKVIDIGEKVEKIKPGQYIATHMATGTKHEEFHFMREESVMGTLECIE